MNAIYKQKGVVILNLIKKKKQPFFMNSIQIAYSDYKFSL